MSRFNATHGRRREPVGINIGQPEMTRALLQVEAVIRRLIKLSTKAVNG